MMHMHACAHVKIKIDKWGMTLCMHVDLGIYNIIDDAYASYICMYLASQWQLTIILNFQVHALTNKSKNVNA